LSALPLAKHWQKRFLLSVFLILLPCVLLANIPLCSSPVDHFEIGLEYYIHGDMVSAIQEFDRDIAQNNHNSASFHARASAFYELGDYSQAIVDYTRCLKLNPGDASAYGNRGLAYSKLGQADNAAADWKRCSRILPGMTRLLEPRHRPKNCTQGKAVILFGGADELEPPISADRDI
jgi:tetratricopeptide (TPR) repeat protein